METAAQTPSLANPQGQRQVSEELMQQLQAQAAQTNSQGSGQASAMNGTPSGQLPGNEEA